jgi:hypothetical protein
VWKGLIKTCEVKKVPCKLFENIVRALALTPDAKIDQIIEKTMCGGAISEEIAPSHVTAAPATSND